MNSNMKKIIDELNSLPNLSEKTKYINELIHEIHINVMKDATNQLVGDLSDKSESADIWNKIKDGSEDLYYKTLEEKIKNI